MNLILLRLNLKSLLKRCRLALWLQEKYTVEEIHTWNILIKPPSLTLCLTYTAERLRIVQN
jgi:hypothetical protein